MSVQPGAKSSAFLSFLLFLLTASALQLFSKQLASSPQLTIVGGFISSLLFFFSLITVGSLEKETKWLEVISCLIVALVFASTVHRVCVTTCFLFSLGLLYYLNTVSKKVRESH
eukprot:TRINITY_DN4020_c0_g1_i1.p1 TRINITY_DN4020_c0_g1~~TRINITY_DN4020_c0_g1_i1.p1  ORF type:complete len:114 (+),score=19.70 TRINITY_DN4020_c0_g1_i1:90-431(+)